jgi:tyrosyl-tRNA synthetase
METSDLSSEEPLSEEIVSKQTLKSGLSIVDVLVAIGLAKSRSDAKRHINQGSVFIYK